LLCYRPGTQEAILLSEGQQVIHTLYSERELETNLLVHRSDGNHSDKQRLNLEMADSAGTSAASAVSAVPTSPPGSKRSSPNARAAADPVRPADLLLPSTPGPSLDLIRAGSSNELLSPGSPSSPGGRRRFQSEPLRIPPQLQVITREMVKMSSTVEGTGSFARVVRATLTKPGETPRPVAVKVMNRARVLNSAFVNLQNELDIVATLRHPCIINTLGAFEDVDNIYIVMDLAEKGELYKYTKELGLEDMPIVAPNFIAEVVLGLEYMAKQGILHRDVKPENLLLTSGYHVKIADFGTVCHLDSPLNKFTGTPTYVSPEMLITSKASLTSDIWALGCVLFHLFVGRSPFQGDTEYQVIEAVKSRNITWPAAEYFPSVARDLVEKMLAMDPAQRIGANGYAEIKRHPFFAPVDWSQLLTKSNETFLNADYTQLYESHLLSTERVVYSALVVKERYKGMSCHERVLVLTDYPQLFYLDPKLTNQKKGFVQWDRDLCAQADSATRFHVYTSGSRTYHFVDNQGRAHLWAAKINHLVKAKPAAAR
jgi:serine/threonine protein kinase